MESTRCLYKGNLYMSIYLELSEAMTDVLWLCSSRSELISLRVQAERRVSRICVEFTETVKGCAILANSKLESGK